MKVTESTIRSGNEIKIEALGAALLLVIDELIKISPPDIQRELGEIAHSLEEDLK